MNGEPAKLIDAELIAAHERGDGPVLARLYERAADIKGREGDVDAACFFLTQAYVFALEAGLVRSSVLRDRLALHGREELPGIRALTAAERTVHLAAE